MHLAYIRTEAPLPHFSTTIATLFNNTGLQIDSDHAVHRPTLTPTLSPPHAPIASVRSRQMFPRAPTPLQCTTSSNPSTYMQPAKKVRRILYPPQFGSVPRLLPSQPLTQRKHKLTLPSLPQNTPSSSSASTTPGKPPSSNR